MSAGHTPGPWAFDGSHRIDALQFRVPSPHKIKNDDGTEREFMLGLVALPYGCEPGAVEANARLIAAAPEMLQALRELQANPNDPRAHRSALDAIAKATGGAA